MSTIYTYIHTCMHAYIHTCMHAYIHKGVCVTIAYMHSHMRTPAAPFEAEAEAELPPTSRGCTSAATACSRTSEWMMTLQVLSGTDASNIMVHTAAVTGCERASRWNKAVLLLESAAQCRLRCDTTASNTVLQACAEGEQWQVCLELCSRHSGMDAVSRNIVTKACSGPGWTRAIRSLRSTMEVSARPGLVGYSAAVQACSQAWPRAHGLFHELRSQHRTPDTIAWGSWVNVLAGEWSMALSSVRELTWWQLQPDAAAYNSLLRAQSGSWPFALSLMLQRIRLFGIDAASAGAVILACCKESAWSISMDLLRLLHRQSVAASTHSLAAVMSACEQEQLEEIRDQVMPWLAEATVDGVAPPASASAELRAAISRVISSKQPGWVPRRPAGFPSSFYSTSGRQGLYRYFKELQLLRHVLRRMESDTPERDRRARDVCEAIEGFGLQGGSRWLKVVGARKASVLEAAVGGATPEGGGVLEIGTYCGYSALRMAQRVPGVAIHTLEVDPIHVVIARNILALAGQEAEAVRVWTGHSQALLPQWSSDCCAQFAAVFMDQRGSRYDEDLDILESRGLVACRAVVIADNALKPGAPLFLWRLQTCGYERQILSLQEFAMPCEDWMTVSVGHRQEANASKPPATILELHSQAETMRRLATKQGGAGVSFEDWSTFARQMRQALSTVGVTATATISDGDTAAMCSSQKALGAIPAFLDFLGSSGGFVRRLGTVQKRTLLGFWGL